MFSQSFDRHLTLYLFILTEEHHGILVQTYVLVIDFLCFHLLFLGKVLIIVEVWVVVSYLDEVVEELSFVCSKTDHLPIWIIIYRVKSSVIEPVFSQKFRLELVLGTLFLHTVNKVLGFSYFLVIVDHCTPGFVLTH